MQPKAPLAKTGNQAPLVKTAQTVPTGKTVSQVLQVKTAQTVPTGKTELTA